MALRSLFVGLAARDGVDLGFRRTDSFFSLGDTLGMNEGNVVQADERQHGL